VITTAVVAELLKNRIPVRQNATKFSMQVLNLVRVESTINPYSLLLSAACSAKESQYVKMHVKMLCVEERVESIIIKFVTQFRQACSATRLKCSAARLKQMAVVGCRIYLSSRV
jgi:hypothetical protein